MNTTEKPLILLVDDQATNLQVLGMLLERDYRIAVAKNGTEALDFVERKKPDLILLDIMMPDIDGFEVCKRLKACPTTQDIPIIFLSAKTESADVIKGFEVGAVDYVTKPFRREELQARVKTHLRLKHAEDLLKQGLSEAQHIAKMGSWVRDFSTNTLTWSDEVYRIFGVDPENFEVTYAAFLQRIHPDDVTLVQQAVDAALHTQQTYNIDHRIMLDDGQERIVHEAAEAAFDADGNAVRMLGTVQDITERKQLEAELRKLSMAIQESIDLVFITDIHGSIEYVNPMFERVTGYLSEEVIGQNPRILASGDTARQQYENMWANITLGKSWHGEVKNKKKNGEFYWGRSVISPIRNDDGEITHFLAIQEDISEKRQAEKRAQFLATYDSLTGLLNRDRFIEFLTEGVAANRHGTLILADIDEFKVMNDIYGHNMADEVLKRVATVMQETLFSLVDQQQCAIGRLGEDELAIAISGKGGREGLKVAEEMRARVERLTFATETIRTTLSAGVVECPTHGTTTNELLSHVDAALFRAKGLGKNRCHLFSPEDQDIERVHSRLQQKDRILRALEEDRFEPWFQPILDLSDRQVHHYEALARMRDAEGNIVLPGAFISIAEALGFIDAIDRRITAKTIYRQAELQQQGHTLSFAMNISGKNLGDEDLLEYLRATIHRAGATPGNLVFEITETAAIQDLARAIRFINALKQMGCRFALDDFGVGFTSFVYLREMAVDFVKIDGAFIRRLHEHAADQGIVKAITMIAREMGIRTIAEFVEQDATLDMLKQFGVDYAQGFLIGKPAPLTFAS